MLERQHASEIDLELAFQKSFILPVVFMFGDCNGVDGTVASSLSLASISS
jgi:hypothetical protein